MVELLFMYLAVWNVYKAICDLIDKKYFGAMISFIAGIAFSILGLT